MIKEQARQLRKLLESSTDSMTDDKIVKFPAFVEKWTTGVEYLAGKRVSYNNIVYKVIQAHKSQDTWTPPDAPSLFAKVLIPTDDDGHQTDIPEWEQPDSTNPYMSGDKVVHNGKTWESTIDNNVWEPGIYGWIEI